VFVGENTKTQGEFDQQRQMITWYTRNGECMRAAASPLLVFFKKKVESKHKVSASALRKNIKRKKKSKDAKQKESEKKISIITRGVEKK